MPQYEFAIKKEKLNSGETVFTPVCRQKVANKFFSFFEHPWNRITRIYDQYFLLELNFTPNLTFEDCELHIKEYKKVLKQQSTNEVQSIELQSLETFS